MSFEYQSDRFRRGLIIDKKRGNVIKIDRHKYVRTVYHGLRELSSDEKKNIYSKQFSSFKESTYVNIDTIFLLVGKWSCCMMTTINKSHQCLRDSRCCFVHIFGGLPRPQPPSCEQNIRAALQVSCSINAMLASYRTLQSSYYCFQRCEAISRFVSSRRSYQRNSNEKSW